MGTSAALNFGLIAPLATSATVPKVGAKIGLTAVFTHILVAVSKPGFATALALALEAHRVLHFMTRAGLTALAAVIKIGV